MEHRVVLAVTIASPDVTDFKQWNVCELWVPHALVCAVWIDEEHIGHPEAARLLDGAGYYLSERARYDKVEPCIGVPSLFVSSSWDLITLTPQPA